MVTAVLLRCALAVTVAALVSAAPALAADAGNAGIDAGHSGFAAAGPTPPLVQRWARSDLAVRYGGPVAAGGSVFVNADRVLALDPSSGATRWTAASTVGPVVAAGGAVFAGRPPGFALGAVDAATGAARWTDNQTMFAGPVADGGLVVVGGVLGVRALNPSTGKQVWGARHGGLGDLALDVKRVYALTGGKSDCVVRAYWRPGLLGLAVQLWKKDCGNTTYGVGLVVAAARVHVGGAVLDAATGRKLHDLPRSRPGGGVAIAPDGSAVVTDDAGVAAHAPDGTRRWGTVVPAAPAGAPLLLGSTVFAATQDGTVRAFDAATGAVTWSTGTPLRGFIGMTVSGDTLVLAGDQGVLAFAPAATGSVRTLHAGAPAPPAA